MKCPSCGAVYSIEEVQFMGSENGYFLLSMTCAKCALPVWVNFFAGEAPNRHVSDLTITDMELINRSEITPDEVIKFHSYIKGFNGDFRQAFRLANKS